MAECVSCCPVPEVFVTMMRVLSACLAIVLVQGFPASAEEPKPPRSLEELTDILQKKGVLSEGERKSVLDALSRETPSMFTGLKGFSLKVNGLGQFRYTFADSGAGSANVSSFKVATARVKFSGDMPLKFKYALQLAFERANGATTQQNSALYDLLLTFAPLQEFNVTAGQFQIPAGAEAHTPTDAMDLANRYNAQDRILNPGTNHDVGVMVSGRALDKRLYYAAGMFNGNGANYVANDDGNHLYSARVEGVPLRWNVGGWDSELSVGVDGMWKRTNNDPSSWRQTDLAATTFNEPFDRTVWGANAAIKAGPAALKGEYIQGKLKGRLNNDPVKNAEGWYLQGGVKVLKGALEPLVRYQTYDPDDSVVNNKDIEWTTLGLNWFIKGQNLRLLANYTFKTEKASCYDNDEFVTQLQLSF